MQEKQMDIMNRLIFILRGLPILQMRTMSASRRLVVLCGSIDHPYRIDHLVLLDPLDHTTYLAHTTPFDPLIHKNEDPFNIIYLSCFSSCFSSSFFFFACRSFFRMLLTRKESNR